MQLTSWFVTGYRNLHEVRLDTERGVLIAGNNNAGKSNILRSLSVYSSLFGEVQERPPKKLWIQQTAQPEDSESGDAPEASPAAEDIGESPSEGSGSDIQQNQPSSVTSWDDWIKSRTSGTDASSITFSATFSPRGTTHGDTISELSDSYYEMLTDARKELGGSTDWLEESALSEGSLDRFQHTLSIGTSGIESEFFETNMSGTNVVIAGRTPSGAIRDLIFDKIGHGGSTDEFSEVTDLQREELDTETIEYLTESDPGSEQDEPSWYRKFRSNRKNIHGGVIPEHFYYPIRDDVSSWRHVPAVRIPKRNVLVDDLTELVSDISLDEDFRNVLPYYFSIKNKEDIDEDTEKYKQIIDDVVSFDVNFRDGEIIATQEERGSEREFTSEDISTGSLQVLCLLSALRDHRWRHETPGSIISIEEPETHLNSHTQRRILDYILDGVNSGVSPILTSHSSTLIDQTRIGEVCIAIQEGSTTTELIDREKLSKLRLVYGVTLSELLQATVLLLVPSPSWSVLIATIADKYGYNFVEDGITLIPCDSISGFELISTVANQINVPVVTMNHLSLKDSHEEKYDYEEEELPAGTVGEFFYEYRRDIESKLDTNIATQSQEIRNIDNPNDWFAEVLRTFGLDNSRPTNRAVCELAGITPTDETEVLRSLLDLIQGYVETSSI